MIAFIMCGRASSSCVTNLTRKKAGVFQTWLAHNLPIISHVVFFPLSEFSGDTSSSDGSDLPFVTNSRNWPSARAGCRGIDLSVPLIAHLGHRDARRLSSKLAGAIDAESVYDP